MILYMVFEVSLVIEVSSMVHVVVLRFNENYVSNSILKFPRVIIEYIDLLPGRSRKWLQFWYYAAFQICTFDYISWSGQAHFVSLCVPLPLAFCFTVCSATSCISFYSVFCYLLFSEKLHSVLQELLKELTGGRAMSWVESALNT